MARRRKAEKTALIPDPQYNSELVTRVINSLMRKGKKTTAQRIVYGALKELDQRVPEEEAVDVLIRGVNNMKPRVEVKSRRVGGTTYQVPIEIRPNRQLALALRWLVQYASGRRGVPMPRAVALEILDAYNNQGNIVKKRDDTHKMAQANKAFAHYAW